VLVACFYVVCQQPSGNALACLLRQQDEHALGLVVVQRYLDTGDVDLGGDFDAVEELTHTNPYLLVPAVAGVGEAGVAGEVLIGRVLSIFFGLGFLGRVSDKFFNRNFGRVFGKFFGEDFEILVVILRQVDDIRRM
jgi:hypothetical protein